MLPAFLAARMEYRAAGAEPMATIRTKIWAEQEQLAMLNLKEDA
jgi:hypothetical protein